MHEQNWRYPLALLLLAAMAAWSLPRSLVHTCDRSEFHHGSSSHEGTVAMVDHCLVCDQAAPSFTESPKGPQVHLPGGYVTLRSESAVRPCDGLKARATSRGPPTLVKAL